MAINQQAISESKKAIIFALDSNTNNFEKEEYKDLLEDLIGDLQIRLEAVTEEIEEEENEEE